MAWHAAPSVAAALAEATRRWPKRSRASDGTIGDTAHAARKSDHNPDAKGIVHAFDLTHDTAHGVDCNHLAAHLITKRDSRVKYIIWNKQICHSTNWTWQAYSGANPHTKHMHVSIHATQQAENDTSDWWAEDAADEVLPIVKYIIREMKKNAAGGRVHLMWQFNNATAGSTLPYPYVQDWHRFIFGVLPGDLTRVARELASQTAAMTMWAVLVRQNGPWDHKPVIRRRFHPRVPNGEQVWHIHGKFLYYYDIWSNIHYGYVGTAAGFSASQLLDGAGLEQIGSDLARLKLPTASGGVSGLRRFDNPSDRASISIGIVLRRKLGANVTTRAVLKLVENTPHLQKKPYTPEKPK